MASSLKRLMLIPISTVRLCTMALGAFEGIRAYQSMNGVKIFKAYEHFERLKKSCALVGIPFQYETEELIQIAYLLLEKNNFSDSYIRPLVYCGPNMSLTQPMKYF